MEKEWLQEQTTVEDAERENLIQDERLGPNPVPFGFANNLWVRLPTGRMSVINASPARWRLLRSWGSDIPSPPKGPVFEMDPAVRSAFMPWVHNSERCVQDWASLPGRVEMMFR